MALILDNTPEGLKILGYIDNSPQRAQNTLKLMTLEGPEIRSYIDEAPEGPEIP